MKENNLTDFNDWLDSKYGPKGSKTRNKFEEGYESFNLGLQIEEARQKLGLTQAELAKKCGTNKSYISRIENDASDIRLSTLLKIIHLGFGGRLILELG